MNPPDIVLKIPFGVVETDKQREFIDLVKKVRPDVVLNKRLEKRLAAKHVKGEDYIQGLGALFLMFVLFDLGHSLAGYLEMLKHYHLAQVEARSAYVPSQTVPAEAFKKAEAEFARAEAMRESEPGISLVHRAILKKGFSVAAVYQSRAEALFYLGKKEEAIESLRKALEYYPKSLKMHIELARWLVETGKLREARAVLSDMMNEHEDVLLPRLYMLVLYRQSGDMDKARRLYDIFSDKLDLEVFGEEPWWPPGGNRYLSDAWTRDDVHFLLEHLIKK